MNEENLLECQSCGFGELEPIEYNVYSRSIGDPSSPTVILCNLCASTASGNAAMWPGQYEHERLLKQASYIGNAIIVEIRKIGKLLA